MCDPRPSLQTIFHHAIELTSSDEIVEFLDSACGGDSQIRAQVEELISSHREAGRFLDGSESAYGATVDPSSEATIGGKIGPYEIREQIGEGGMGTVYVAEQEKPFRRKVALKVIKPGMDSKAVLARFEAERQAIALMDHPNIAKVLDAGTTDQGRPYFAMELIQGQPITEYCDEKKLTISERMEAFTYVCKAVHHAHQKGVIHRDIKPNNVLVTEIDGQPVPKVIDFGVAKALGTSLTEHTVYTSFQALVGTPMYMSPEQAKLSGVDVDTRSDVYSLGVLLYELLTGAFPFDRDRIKEAALDEVCRIIREEDPPSLSQRVSLLDVTVTEVSQNRGTDRGRLLKILQSEPTWIVAKAMEKDRNRRYETVDQLASDVRRYIQGDAVQACPPSVLYRWTKVAARNKDILAATSFAMFILLAGLAITSWQWKSKSKLVEKLIISKKVESEATRVAQKEAAQSRRLLYIADMNSAAAAEQQGDVKRALNLLGRHAGEDDLKGPEWYFLGHRCRALSATQRTIELGYGARGLAISSRDNGLVAALQNNSIAVIDPTEGTSSPFGPGNHTWINGYVAFSRDGSKLIAPHSDLEFAVLRLWPSLTQLRVFGPHDDAVCSVAVSPDDQFVATGDRSGSISIWQQSTGLRLDREAAHQSMARVAFSNEGWLASCGRDPVVKTWQVAERRLVPGKPYHMTTGGVGAIAFSNDSSTIAIGSRNQIALWDTKKDEIVARLYGHQDLIRTLEFSHDDSQLLSASRDKTVRLWDVAEQRELLKKMVHSSIVTSAAFLDSETVASVGFEGRLEVWSTDSSTGGRQKHSMTMAKDLTFTVDGQHVLVASPMSIVKVNVDTSEREALPVTVESGVIASSINGHVAIGGRDGTVELRALGNWQGGDPTFCTLKEEVYGIDFSPDGHRLAILCLDGKVRVMDVRSKSHVAQFDLETSTVEGFQRGVLAFSPDGGSLAWADRSMNVFVGDLSSEAPRELGGSGVSGHNRSILKLAFSPDGKWLASCDWGGSVHVWDLLGKGAQKHRFEHPLWTRCICFSPDSETLIVSCGDGTLRFWDVRTGQQKCSLECTAFNSMRVSPRGDLLAGLRNDLTLIDIE